MCNFKNLFVPPLSRSLPAGVECSQTYVKLRKNEQIVNSVLFIYSLRRSLNLKYTDNLGL